MDESVIMYEPDLALFADEGLALYKKMAAELLNYLSPQEQHTLILVSTRTSFASGRSWRVARCLKSIIAPRHEWT